ncbi:MULTISPECIES: SLC13 family permease [Clostridium]|uniref:SLC13 family permease n=1 Tax=Clostridium TaxID=1485 RepID=UPI001586F65D|nr:MULTISPECIES: SLC13 family permease [Clostridium]
MLSLIICIAILLSIFIGFKLRINTGLVAIPFAYVIGCFFLKLKPAEVISMWPISIFFVILTVSLFFTFAVVNGTLEVLSQKLLYGCRTFPILLPLAIFFISALIAALGAGYYSVMVLMAPVALIICKKIEIHPLVGALCADCGAQVGSNFMISLNGVIYRKLIIGEGFSDSKAFTTSISIFFTYLVMTFMIITLLILYYKRKRVSFQENASIELKKPEQFNQKQKTNLYLILIFVIVLLVPPILHFIVPKNANIAFLNSNLDVGLISTIFIVIASFLKLADSKEVLTKVPWNTLVMISGVGMLVAVAIKAGTVNILAHWVGGNIPVFFVPIVLTIVAAVITSFGSFIGIVAPALFPVVSSISHLTGLNPTMLYTCITVGGLSAGISPFSAGGAIVLGFTAEKERDDMMKKELFVGLPLCIGASVLVSIIYFFIFH